MSEQTGRSGTDSQLGYRPSIRWVRHRGGLSAGWIVLLALIATVLSAVPAQAVVRVTPDIQRLPVGSMPQLPYVDWAARRIVDGSRAISISGIQGRVVELHKVDGGYLLRRDLDDRSQDLVFVSTSGSRKAIVKLLSPRSIRVSLDGGKVALSRLRVDRGERVYADTVVLALPSGAVLSVRDFGVYQPELHLFGTARVLLTVADDAGGTPAVHWWTPATGATEVVAASSSLETADLSAWQWAIRPLDGVNTYGVRPIPPDSGAGWRVSQEDFGLGSWSTDDALIWGNNEETDREQGYGSSSYLINRADNGLLLLSIGNIVDPWATWESDSALLLRSAYGSGSARRYQLIRCRLSGACSRIGAPSTTPALSIIPATRRG